MSQIQPGAASAPSREGGYLSLQISEVFLKQQQLDQAPWHSDGGDWTFMKCRFAGGTDGVLIGVLSLGNGSSSPIGFGEAFMQADGPAAAQFVSHFAKAFHEADPPKQGNKPTGWFRIRTADFGSSLARSPDGGFSGTTSGTWAATKWFFHDDKDESEVFFNFSLAEKKAEFSEKDEEYRMGLVAEFTASLRDGPPPERTPENDPTLSLTGPKFMGWQRIAGANEYCNFFGAHGDMTVTTHSDEGTSRLSIIRPLPTPHREVWADFEGWATVHSWAGGEDAPVFLLPIDFKKDRAPRGYEDRRKLLLVTRGGQREIPLPETLTAWQFPQQPFSPDGAYVVVQQRIPGESKMPSEALHIFNAADGTWKTAVLKDTILDVAAWEPSGKQAVVISGSQYETRRDLHRAFHLDPAQGILTPLDSVPRGYVPGEMISPDGKYLVELHEHKSLVVTETATGNRRELKFHPQDRQHASDYNFRWAGSDYLSFETSRSALINLKTLKISFPEPKDGFGYFLFSKDFKWVRGAKGEDTYLGRVELPGKE